MNNRGNPPSIRELQNVWLCRPHDREVRPEFCTVVFTDGRIQEIRAVDYRRYLHGHTSGHPPARTKAAKSLPAESTRVGEQSDQQSGGVIDAGARVATPPAVNFHEHFYSRLAKGPRHILATVQDLLPVRQFARHIGNHLDEP